MPTITRLPRATAAETLRLGLTMALPAVAQGVILRRPLMVRLASLADAEGRAVKLLRRLRAKHGDSPLLVRVPLRGWAVLPLASQDVRRVLDEASFTPANREKRGALGHFQPDAVLVTSDPELRDRRRALHEHVLHSGTASFERVIREEAATLPHEGVLTWKAFHAAHWRVARRIVLGDAARDDVTLTRLLDRLRGDANWFYLRGRRTDVRNAFQRRLARHLRRAEPGSLAAVLAGTHAAPDVHPEGQVPHWLFAYDAAAMAAYRALALLATHPGPLDAAHLRAAVLESVRLWPTTLAILRDTTVPTEWDVPEGTVVAIYSPYVNRAESGDTYRPELWLGGDTWAGVPFSGGFARCPGEDLVLFTAATLLETFLREREVFPSVRLEGALPASLDHFRLRFAVRGRGL
ncbi:cytochrome P450 [Nonomuraea sp. LPB2021202275-12-8]|uniref:cytochrome P450 n=1 Tax=Nonomuraea sp. LPB2021202275-12-8 TaxID=3120159 RepID=UPI00300C786B